MKKKALCILTLLMGGLSVFGAEKEMSVDDISRELANPNTSLANLNFKNEFRTFEGDLPNADSQHSFMTTFQPVLPFSLDNGDSVIFRPAIPLSFDQPAFNTNEGDFDNELALGDIYFDLVYTKTSPTGWITAYGVAGTLPTGTDDSFTRDKFSLGPEVLFGRLTKDYLIAAFPNHQWDISGSGDSPVNRTTAQLIAIHFPGGGWNYGSIPIVSYDWQDEQWDVPLNVTVGKTMVIKGRPWRIGLEANYYTEKSDLYGTEWMFGLTITPVVENVLEQFFR